MSRRHDIVRIKLGAIEGAMLVYRKENRFSRLDIKQAVNDCTTAVENMYKELTGISNQQWAESKWNEYREFIFAEPDRDFQMNAAFAYMCSRLAGDILDEFNYSHRKMALVMPISDNIDTILEFCDPTGKNRVAYDLSKKWLNRLDEIVGLETV